MPKHTRLKRITNTILKSKNKAKKRTAKTVKRKKK